jgi:hypothetical protein
MKKGLLMTSALVAAGTLTLGDNAFAQNNPVKLRLGGYYEAIVGTAFQRPPNYWFFSSATNVNPNTTATVGASTTGGFGGAYGAQNTYSAMTEAELHVIGDGRLDNGLVIRTVYELEISGSPGRLYDEAYIILRNGFGQVIVGAEDPVSELMTAGYGNGLVAHAGQNITYDVQAFIPAPPTMMASPTNSAARAAFIEAPDNNDATKVIYVSPRMMGFQAGISYASEIRDQLYEGSGAGGSGGLDTNRRLPAKDALHDMWSFGLNYETAIANTWKIGLAAGYSAAQKPTSVGRCETSDPWMWGIGGRVDMGPWRFLVGYKANRNFVTCAGNPATLWSTMSTAVTGAASNSADGYGVNAGIMYTWGPNSVSMNGSHGTERGTTFASTVPNGDESDKVDRAIASYARNLAPGIKWTANLIWASFNDGPVTDIDNRGFAATSTIRLQF